jgi:hypothetical protein
MAAVTIKVASVADPDSESVLAGASADLVQEILRNLVRQRQDLRRGGADRASLEANRLAIVYWQQRLYPVCAAERRRRTPCGTDGPAGL